MVAVISPATRALQDEGRDGGHAHDGFLRVCNVHLSKRLSSEIADLGRFRAIGKTLRLLGMVPETK
jgi:hypothetical protein